MGIGTHLRQFQSNCYGLRTGEKQEDFVIVSQWVRTDRNFGIGAVLHTTIELKIEMYIDLQMVMRSGLHRGNTEENFWSRFLQGY